MLPIVTPNLNLLQLIDVGFFVCLDSFLSLLTVMPTRIMIILWRLFNTRLVISFDILFFVKFDMKLQILHFPVKSQVVEESSLLVVLCISR